MEVRIEEKIKYLKNYNQNGIAFPFQINQYLNSEDLEKEYLKYNSKSEKIFNRKLSLKPHLLSTFFYNLSVNKTIIDKVKKVIGENVYIWSSAFFSKEPGEGKIVSYHQDNPYWQLSTDKVVTAWIALTKSDELSGALEIVPGSHKLGLIKKLDVDNARESYLNGEKTSDDNDLISYKQNLDKFISDNPPHLLEMIPGQYSLHHVNTVHGSGINRSSHRRIGYAVRYISSETKHLEANEDRALHVCGKKNSYYIDEFPPKNDFDDNAIKQYKMSMSSTGVFGNKIY